MIAKNHRHRITYLVAVIALPVLLSGCPQSSVNDRTSGNFQDRQSEQISSEFNQRLQYQLSTLQSKTSNQLNASHNESEQDNYQELIQKIKKLEDDNSTLQAQVDELDKQIKALSKSLESTKTIQQIISVLLFLFLIAFIIVVGIGIWIWDNHNHNHNHKEIKNKLTKLSKELNSLKENYNKPISNFKDDSYSTKEQLNRPQLDNTNYNKLNSYNYNSPARSTSVPSQPSPSSKTNYYVSPNSTSSSHTSSNSVEPYSQDSTTSRQRTKIIYEVSVPQENLQNRRAGKREPVIFEQQSRGNYRIHLERGTHYLVPSDNLKIDQFNIKSVRDIFTCHGYQDGSKKFTVSQPAVVQSIVEGQTWKLQQVGVLNFNSS